MNPIDVLILVLVGTLAVLGLRRGFLLGAVDLVATAVALLVAARFYRDLVGPLVERGVPREIVAPLAFVALAAAAMLAASFLVGALLRPLFRLPWPPPLRWLNGLLGLLPGAAKGIVLAAIVVIPLAFWQSTLNLRGPIQSSRLADPLVRVGLDALYDALARYDIDLGDFAALTSRADEAPIALPFRVTDGLAPDPTAETEMLKLVNAARADAGLAPLTLDPALTAAARAHSEEMFRLGYFAHDSPTAGDPAQRLSAAGIPFLLMGENLAFAPTVPVAHQGLMESPGHRANILNSAFTRVGIGVVRSPNRGLMISQEFAS